MGQGNYTGFTSTPGGNASHTLIDNLPSLTAKFPTTPGGFFGQPSQRKNSHARIITCDDPIQVAEMFFSLSSQGATIKEIREGAWSAHLKDDVTITYRVISNSDGSPAVQLTIDPKLSYFVKSQRIHFVRSTP